MQSGDYSDVMKDALKVENEMEDYYVFTEDEMKQNQGASDFFGLNHYGSDIVKYSEDEKYNIKNMPRCEGKNINNFQ